MVARTATTGGGVPAVRGDELLDVVGELLGAAAIPDAVAASLLFREERQNAVGRPDPEEPLIDDQGAEGVVGA